MREESQYISASYGNKSIPDHSRAICGAQPRPNRQTAVISLVIFRSGRTARENTPAQPHAQRSLFSRPERAPIDTAVRTILLFEPLVGLLEVAVPEEAPRRTKWGGML